MSSSGATTSAGAANEVESSPHRSNAGEGIRSTTTPSLLSHKTSMYSTAETYASATDGEGYYTDEGVTNPLDDVAGTIHAFQSTTHSNGQLSRSSSQGTARHQPHAESDQCLSEPPAFQAATTNTAQKASGSNVVAPLASKQHTSETTQTEESSNGYNGHPDFPSPDTVVVAEDEEPGQQLEPFISEPPFHHRLMRHLAILALLSFAAIWGTLARKGLTGLNTYDGQSVEPLIWAQAVGCLVMGLAIGQSNKNVIEKNYPPAYIMITTGFCGSVTTFSSWMLDVFRAFGNQQHFNRTGLHNVMDALTQTGLTFGMAIVSIAAGMALSHVINVKMVSSLLFRFSQQSSRSSPKGSFNNEKGDAKPTHDENDRIDKPPSTFKLDTSMLVLGALFWIGSAILCGTYAPFRKVTFSLIFAPPGAILRWYLSRLNSSSISKKYSLPLGTLAANLLGTAVICAAFTATRSGRIPATFSGGVTGCQVLKGLEDGFCGCLSTVSTFAVELRTIKPAGKAVRYAILSWTAGIIICILLVGAPWWSIGMDGSCLGLIST